jgi:predicted secreted protein
MSWISFLAIYFILWWVVLFAVLPIGVRNAFEEGADLEEGHEAGAPVRPQLWRKAIMTTVISLAIYLLFYALLSTGVLDLQKILNLFPGPMR